MKKKGLLLAFVVSLAGHAWSQQHLSLEEAISASVDNNPSVKLSALDVQIAKAKFRQTDAMHLPNANFSYTAFTTNNPVISFAADKLNPPAATNGFSVNFEVHQPLINPDAIYQRKAAATTIEMDQFIEKRTKERLAFETKKAYLYLQVAYEDNKVLTEALSASKAVYKTSKDYFDQGLIQKSELLNAELHSLNIETQLRSSQSAIKDASDMLSILMGRSTGTVYTTDPIAITDTDNSDLPGDRPDFKALQKAMQSYDMMIKSSKMSYLPKLNAFATFNAMDKNPFGFNANTYFAGIQLSWNIFNGNRTRNIISQQQLEKQKLNKQLQQQKSEAQLQVQQARRQLYDASFAMHQQRLAVEQASEALRVLQNRYTQGLAKPADVLSAQTQLSQQKLGYAHAVFNYNLAATSLQFLTSK